MFQAEPIIWLQGLASPALTAIMDVPFTPKNAMTMLALARGLVDGQATSFEDFVFERATKLSDQLAAEDRVSKND